MEFVETNFPRNNRTFLHLQFEGGAVTQHELEYTFDQKDGVDIEPFRYLRDICNPANHYERCNAWTMLNLKYHIDAEKLLALVPQRETDRLRFQITAMKIVVYDYAGCEYTAIL